MNQVHWIGRGVALFTAVLCVSEAAPGSGGKPCMPHWNNTIGQPGLNGSVNALTVFDGSSGKQGIGPGLYVGGDFNMAGGVSVNRIARWDGASWSALGSGVSGHNYPWVWAMTVFDDGAGPALYAGGGFTSAGGVEVNHIAKWDGASWSPLGSGMSSRVFALTVFDDGSGSALYACGTFYTAGGVPVNGIAKWDGESWSALGNGIGPEVYAMAVFDDGSGPALYVGGWIHSASGVPVNGIAKWNGETWSALASGVSGEDYAPSVNALTVFDGGSGPALYAGGNFTTAGGVSANYIARWDGESWSALGSGIAGYVYAVSVFDDGTGGGPALYAGGSFWTAGGVSANSIAKWDGESWTALDSGMSGGPVYALTVLDDDGGGSALCAGGGFWTAGGQTANRIAYWLGCTTAPECPMLADFNCDGIVDVLDLLILLGAWGGCPSSQGSCIGDLNGDGNVDVLDLLVLLANWG